MNSGGDAFLAELSVPVPQRILHNGRAFGPGTRVILRLEHGGDLLDLSLHGSTGVVEAIEQDDRGNFLIAVIPDAYAGQDLASTRHPSHRFLFSPAELELEISDRSPRRILIAGIGNLFFGDDGFGCAVIAHLNRRELPAGVDAADFGIRGIDLAYALGRSYHAAILIDALPPSASPGRISLVEPRVDSAPGTPLDPHRIDPVAVLVAARNLAPLPQRVLLVGCEAATIPDGDALCMELSTSVRFAVDRAAELALAMAKELQEDEPVDYRPS